MQVVASAIRVLAGIVLCASMATAADNGQRKGKSSVKGLVVTPAQPGSSVQRFGSGAVVKPSDGSAPTTVQPFGNGVLVKEPGKPDVVCSPFGSSVTCR